MKKFSLPLILAAILVLAGCTVAEPKATTGNTTTVPASIVTASQPTASPTAATPSTSATEAPDKLQVQLENDHFLFHSCNKDKPCIADLAKRLEDNYQRITGDLKVTGMDQVDVYVYPDIKTYHAAIGMPNAPNWQVGGAMGRTIKMVSPLNPGSAHTYDSVMQVIVHEFTHIVIGTINTNVNRIPMWLNEGLATYEARQDNTAQLKGKLTKDTLPSLSTLDSTNFNDQGGYVCSYIAVEYFVKNKGYDGVIELIKAPDQLETILGVSEAKFEDQWKDYCIKEYN